jgi:5-formyltetrahydrofolate cyclo-ligase
MAEHTPEVRALRRRLREQRLALDGTARRSAEDTICARLLKLPAMRRGARVAAYLAMPGEVDLSRCIERAQRRGVDMYAPRIGSLRRREMSFVSLGPGAARELNAYGIEEPERCSPPLPPIALDVVIVPLVAFDRHGQRLGMGAGFYDRALRRLRDRDRRWRRPRLVGVAFSFQQVPEIPAAPWDVPLDLVVTEREVIVPRRESPSRTLK